MKKQVTIEQDTQTGEYRVIAGDREVAVAFLRQYRIEYGRDVVDLSWRGSRAVGKGELRDGWPLLR